MQTQGHERHAAAPGVCDVFPQQIQLSRCRLGIIVLWQRLQASSRAPYYATYRLTALQQEQHSAMCCLQSCNIQLFCRSAFNDVRSSTPCHTRTEDSNHQESELALRGRSYLRHDQELTGFCRICLYDCWHTSHGAPAPCVVRQLPSLFAGVTCLEGQWVVLEIEQSIFLVSNSPPHLHLRGRCLAACKDTLCTSVSEAA